MRKTSEFKIVSLLQKKVVNLRLCFCITATVCAIIGSGNLVVPFPLDVVVDLMGN